MTLREKREKRSRLIAEGREILKKAEEEKRKLTPEEESAWSKAFDEQQALGDEIAREERQREAERQMEERLAEQEEGSREPGDDVHERRDHSALVMQGFRSFILNGRSGMTGDGVEEFRALQSGSNVDGGYLRMPETFINSLIQGLDDTLYIRQLATKYRLGRSASIGAASLDSDIDDAEWTTELQTGDEDDGMALGKRKMQPHPMAKRIKVSNNLMRTATLSPEALVRERLLYKLGVTQEKAYLLGSGAERPLGVFVASAQGIPSSRDVSEDNTATSMTMDGLKNAKYALKAAYWQRATWLFHRDGVKQVAKLKDGDGQYMWAESVREGEPDRLLSRPVLMSEFAPNTFTTGQYVGMVADFSHYWILDSLEADIKRLDELYAETDQTGFIARYEGDGAPVLAEAFVRIKLG